jgi:Protein of unknown function (DUF3455)
MKVGFFVLAVVTALGAAPNAAVFDRVTPPPVPSDLNVNSDETAFLIAHAVGTQNYVCLPAAAGGFAWVLFGPQATLFDEDGGQIVTHFLSANPAEGGLPRPTWQHSRDTSSVWAALVKSSTDPAYVEPNAIPWFLLRPVGTQYGPEGGARLTRTSAIQRVNTSGGLAPATGCALSTDVGRKALVPYSADYVFYRVRE